MIGFANICFFVGGGEDNYSSGKRSSQIRTYFGKDWHSQGRKIQGRARGLGQAWDLYLVKSHKTSSFGFSKEKAMISYLHNCCLQALSLGKCSNWWQGSHTHPQLTGQFWSNHGHCGGDEQDPEAQEDWRQSCHKRCMEIMQFWIFLLQENEISFYGDVVLK